MPVTFVTDELVESLAKEVQSQQTVTKELVLVEVIDSFIEKKTKLDKELAKLKPLQKEVDELEKLILAPVDEVMAAEVPVTLSGTKMDIGLTPKGNSTTITDMEQAKAWLGQELFMKIAKITLADLKTYLSGMQIEKITKEERTSKRRVTIKAKV